MMPLRDVYYPKLIYDRNNIQLYVDTYNIIVQKYVLNLNAGFGAFVNIRRTRCKWPCDGVVTHHIMLYLCWLRTASMKSLIFCYVKSSGINKKSHEINQRWSTYIKWNNNIIAQTMIALKNTIQFWLSHTINCRSFTTRTK